MKKIFIVAAIVFAVTSFAISQPRYNGTGNTPECTLTYITESLPGFTLGEPAHFQIEACCGTPPYNFEIVMGTLPDGLHLNNHGKISGKPREEADTTIFVELTDDAGCSLTQAFQVRVEP